MKKAKVVGIVLLCCAVVSVFFLYVTLVYMRTPDYVHKHITPPYEEEAVNYFYANLPELKQFSELKDAISANTIYYYTFHEHTFNTPGIPEEVLNILLILEGRTEAQYTVSISRFEIDVYIATGTNFDVFLYHGNPLQPHSINPETEKETRLEAGWTVEAPYTLRG